MDETTQEWLDSKFDESGEPVETGGADFGSFTDDDFLYDNDVPSGPRSERELADLYASVNNDEAAVGRVNELIDQGNDRLVDELDSYPDYGEQQQGLSSEGQEQPGIPFPGSPQAPGETDEQFAYRVAGEVLQGYLAGEATRPAPPTAEQQLSAAIASATTESLASLAAIEESKAARSAQYDAQAEAVYAQQLNEAAYIADDLIGKALEKHGAGSFDRQQVFEAANAVMEASGWVGPEFDALPEWQRAQFAQAAIDKAAGFAHTASVTHNVLGPLGWKGPRTR